ncbi:MAG TPA: hypothetical protein VJY34_12235 [Roseiarcus sp.]|nr:hypothetical protein [Roseiarcus sp.]
MQTRCAAEFASLSSLARRAALASLAGLVFVPAVFLHGAFARRPVQPGGIRVDVTPLRENAGDPTATWVERELPGALEHALTGHTLPGPLTVRIDYLTLGPNTPASIHGGSSPDNISGVVFIGGARIPVHATTNYMASPVDQTMIEQSNHERVSQLVQALAYWIAAEARTPGV